MNTEPLPEPNGALTAISVCAGVCVSVWGVCVCVRWGRADMNGGIYVLGVGYIEDGA